MSWRIHSKDVTESTNLDARSGVPGDVFTAREQTAGRGRLDHKWFAKPGENLTFSAVVDVSDAEPSRVATIPLVVGLALTRILNGEDGYLSGTSFSAEVKWPNDILVDGRKLCGILCERHGDGVIVGIGFNVNQSSFPPEIENRATSLSLILGHTLSIDDVLKAILSSLDELLAEWRVGGFECLVERFRLVDALKGRTVSVKSLDDDSNPVRGICSGVNEDGSLKVGGVDVFAGEVHIAEWR